MSGIIVGGDCRIEGLLSAYDNLLITNDDANGTILNFLNTSVSSHTANIKLNTSYFQINDESDTNVLYFDTSNSLSQIYINRSLGVLGGSSLISKDVINSNLLSATDVNTSNCTVSSLTASKIVVSDTNKKLVSSSIDASELSKLTNVVVKNPTAPQIISGNYLQMILTNSTDAALVVRDSTATVASQLVIYAGGKVEWGSGTASRDTNLYRLGANYLRTDDKFESSQGIRTIGYSSSGLTGPGLEMHYDGGSNFGRILCIDRPTSTRKSIWIDGLDITFYTNAGNIRAGITSGGDFRLDGFSTTPYVLVSDANKYIKQSTITTTKLDYLSDVTSNIQSQLDGKVAKIGDTMTGNLLFNNTVNGTWLGVTGQVGSNDFWRVSGRADANDAGYLEIATADGGDEPIYVRQYLYSGGEPFGTIVNSLTLLDANGKTAINDLTATTLNVSGSFTIGGVSGLKGSGTAERLARFTATTTLGDSNLGDNGSKLIPYKPFDFNIGQPGSGYKDQIIFTIGKLMSTNNSSGTIVSEIWTGNSGSGNAPYIQMGESACSLGYGNNISWPATGLSNGYLHFNSDSLFVNIMRLGSHQTLGHNGTMTDSSIFAIHNSTTAGGIITLPSPEVGKVVYVAIAGSPGAGTHIIEPPTGCTIEYTSYLNTPGEYVELVCYPVADDLQTFDCKIGFYIFLGVSTTRWLAQVRSGVY